MKRKLIICFLLCVFLLTGCFDYQDLNMAIFATGTIIDINESGNIVLYTELFHAYRSKESNQEKGTRLILTNTGKTLMEAIRNLNRSSSYKVSFEQNKVIVFTKRAAEYGLENFIDFLNKDQELILRQYILIYDGEPKDLITLKVEQEEYIGLYLYDLMRSELVENFIDNIQLYEYLNNRHMGEDIEVISIIRIEEKALQKNVKIEDAAVLKKDKLIEIMDKKDIQAYDIIMGRMSSGILVLPHPTVKNKNITLEIMNNKLKSSIYHVKDENRIIWENDFNITTMFAEAQAPIELDSPEIRKKIEKSVEEIIKKEGTKLFEKYKEKDLDVFDIKTRFSRKYPHDEVKDPLRIADIKISADVNLKGSPNVQDFD